MVEVESTEETQNPEETVEEQEKEVEAEKEEPKVVAPTASFVLSEDREGLEAFLRPIATLVDEAVFTVGTEGLTLRQMDASRVAMIDFHYRMQNLESFQSLKDGLVCFNIENMLKVIRRAGKDDKITITSNPEDTLLNVAISGKYNRSFNVPCLEPDDVEVPIPKLTATAKVTTTVEQLRSVVADSELVSDHVKLTTKDDVVQFRANGDLMSAESTWRKTDEALLDVEGEAKATFSLSYLSDIVKSLPKDTVARIAYADDMPVKIDVSNGIGTLLYFLAPRVEPD